MRVTQVLPFSALLLLLALSPPPAAAQSGARLSGREIVQLLEGKRIMIRHDRIIRGAAWDSWDWAHRTDGSVVDLEFLFRNDGSYRRHCTIITRTGDRPPCGGISSGVSTGVWEVRGASLCFRELVVARGREWCLEIERAGARYRFRAPEGASRPTKGQGFFDGLEFEVKP